MTDLEILRKAAELMWQRAKAASLGRWSTDHEGLVWAPRLGDPVSGSVEPEDAEHIAALDPDVALAIADWLDMHAADLDRAGGLVGACESPADVMRATKVARTYLRVEEVSQ